MLYKKESPATRLLISMLIRYPEVTSVRYEPSTKSIVLSFFLQGFTEPKLIEDCQCELQTYIEMCAVLEGKRANVGKLEFTTHDQLTIITYGQSIDLITNSEILLLTHILHSYFSGQVTLEPISIGQDDLQYQEELINRLLGHREEFNEEKHVLAYREDGRVYVYNQ